jgi:beta-mannosidase
VQLDEPRSLFVKNSDFDLYRRGQLNNLPPDETADWVFNASIDVVGRVPKGASMRYTVVDSDSRQIVGRGNFGSVENGGDVVTGVTTLDASKYQLWWPNGLDPQKLYNITVDVVIDGKSIIASVNKRMGFRTIVLNTEPISEEQLSLGIINGSNCKAHHIPGRRG